MSNLLIIPLKVLIHLSYFAFIIDWTGPGLTEVTLSANQSPGLDP